MSAENVALMTAACWRGDADRTDWLVFADALQEVGREDEARLIREEDGDVLLIADVVRQNRVPGWYLIYAPDEVDDRPELNQDALNVPCPRFDASCGLVVRGEESARQIVTALTPELEERYGPDHTGLVVEPLQLRNLPITSCEREEIAEFIFVDVGV
jgi:uncharacterized protein (TIGR02996 family)